MRLGADLGRHHVVHPHRRAPARDAEATIPVGATVKGGGVPFILGQLPSWLQDFLLLLIIFAFFSCGTSVQGAGAGSRFSFARDGALPGSRVALEGVSQRFQTPVNALLPGAVVHGAVRPARLHSPGPGQVTSGSSPTRRT